MAETAKQKTQIAKVMHEFKQGSLKSSAGPKVKSKKQAVAIALNEAGASRKKRTGSK
jgi:hypothetical protein